MKTVYSQGESWKTGSTAKKERQDIFMEWLLTPPDVREPKTRTELALSLGVDTSTLWRYENEKRFQKDFQARKRGLFKVTDASRVIDSLLEIATDTSNRNAVSAARTLLDWMDKSTEDETTDIKIQDMSVEDLLDLAKELDERSRAKTGTRVPPQPGR